MLTLAPVPAGWIIKLKLFPQSGLIILTKPAWSVFCLRLRLRLKHKWATSGQQRIFNNLGVLVLSNQFENFDKFFFTDFAAIYPGTGLGLKVNLLYKTVWEVIYYRNMTFLSAVNQTRHHFNSISVDCRVPVTQCKEITLIYRSYVVDILCDV